MGFLRYRAGARAQEILRSKGFDAARIGAVVGPASGPKWLVLAGIDHVLMDDGLLDGAPGHRPLLVGASAGAWRMLAMASRRPRETHRALLDLYISQVFDRQHTPQIISAAYRDMLEQLFPEEEMQHILNHSAVDVGVHVTRPRGGRWMGRRPMQLGQLLLAMALCRVHRHGVGTFFEGILLHSAPGRMARAFDGRLETLDARNFLAASMATGSVPMYLEPVGTLAGLGPGPYVDGGVTDYHLNRPYVGAEDDRIVVLPHYQERIAPTWFDKHREGRRPPAEHLDSVLQLYPSEEFVQGLPGGRIPDRDEFQTFMDAPDERLRRWREAAALSERLGEELSRDLESGRWVDRLESF